MTCVEYVSLPNAAAVQLTVIHRSCAIEFRLSAFLEAGDARALGLHYAIKRGYGQLPPLHLLPHGPLSIVDYATIARVGIVECSRVQREPPATS